MTDRFNTFAGWFLATGIVVLLLAYVSGQYFRADKEHRPATMGFVPAGVEQTGSAAAQGPTFDELLATADPAAGAKVFAKCMACHTIDQGAANGIGPNLYGVVGEPIGKGKGGFAFSDALAGVGGNWNFDELDKWLTSPKAFAPGTKMTFAGLPKAEDRANVVAYLNSMGSNLPLPKPAPAPAADASAAPAADASAAPAEAAPAK